MKKFDFVFIQPLYDWLNGEIIDCLDYYCFLSRIFKVPPLLFICKEKTHFLTEQIRSIIEERYSTTFDFIVNDRDLLKSTNFWITLGLGSFEILMRTLPQRYFVIGQFSAQEFHLKSHHSKCPNDYVTDYQLKIPFDLYKLYHEKPNCLYINTLDVAYPEKFLLDCSQQLGYDSFFVKKRRHESRLFDKFRGYLYIDDGKYYDCHPRLFHECHFHKKEIIFISGRKNGAYERFKEIQDGQFHKRVLSAEDDIIYCITQYLNL